MTPVHVHLALNHAPLFATLFGAVLLAWALFARNASAVRISLVVFVVGAALTVPVFFTGEPTEETVENLAGVTRSAIEPHEDAAKLATVSVGLLGLVSLAALVTARKRPEVAPGLAWAALLLAVVAGLLLAYTSMLGGRVHHPEVAPGAAAPAAEREHEPKHEERE